MKQEYREAHVLPGLKYTSLISILILCDAVYQSIFEKKTEHIISKGENILEG